MIELDGAKLPALPLVGLETVRDLEHFDGPLLTHFRHPRGDHYLYYWCDCDEHVNRWMVMRVGEANIIRLINRFVPLDYVIPKECQDDFAYFVDIDGAGQVLQVVMLGIDGIPGEYIPAQGAYLDADVAKDERSYSVLLESDLSLHHLSDLPRVYSQVYALLYTLGILKPGRLEGYPWRGGFSAMHFYRWLVDRLPGEHRPALDSIQYASPGFMRFTVHRATAAKVAKCLALLAVDSSEVRAAYSHLMFYIRENKLNDLPLDLDGTQGVWQKHDVELAARTKLLLSALDVRDLDTLIDIAARPFEAAKISTSFVRRLMELASLERDGFVRFPSE